MSKFLKFDNDKPMLELVDPNFILGVGGVLTMGATKYGVDNWKSASKEDIERIKGALLRHTMAYLSGEVIDPESGLNHMYHIACNTMFLSYFDNNKELL